jgi:xanthine dehydrogenase YagS FAD-binding subunit
MHSFILTQAEPPGRADPPEPGAMFIAGGTDLLQLMKNDVIAPSRLMDISGLDLRGISASAQKLQLGALATMSEVAAHPAVRNGWPMIAEALLSSASPQVRNMGTMGGNLLQRTRCNYFRDVGFACNKRQPGSGCPAIAGENRDLAVFGGSDKCIATHPSDLPVALMALDAEVELVRPGGKTRRLVLSEFYRLPGMTPEIETVLKPGELITGISVPASAAARKSTYLKLRDRASFAFALVSAAVGLDIAGGRIRDVRVALGGVAPMPWRLPEVEAALRGKPPGDAVFREAVRQASDGARVASQNGFKIQLAQRVVVRALQTVAA